MTPPSSLRRRWVAALEMAAFAGGFLAVSLVFLSFRPVPSLPRISEKFAYFARHKDEFDVVFFGSSRIQRGIVPEEFDAAMAAAGRPVRSFNFGLDGVFAPESHFILDQVLALKPARLKLVFLELTPVQTQIGDQYRETIRAWFWHDALRTKWALKELFSEPLPGSVPRQTWPWTMFGERGFRLRQVAEHLRLLTLRYGNAGRGFEYFDDSLDHDAVERVGDGWTKARRTVPLEGMELSKYQQALGIMRAAPVARRQGPGFKSAYLHAAESIRAAGAKPVFFTAATIDSVRDYYPDEPAPASVLAFNDPDEFAVLYGANARTDGEHANEFGARAFTRLLAARFLAEVASQPTSQ